ncbi:hypothetical protein BD414DRAFT_111546 [Trametes punicea]|nr:hypothetical protein BD414DRAFT_111546 [Trametes punicea]
MVETIPPAVVQRRVEENAAANADFCGNIGLVGSAPQELKSLASDGSEYWGRSINSARGVASRPPRSSTIVGTADAAVIWVPFSCFSSFSGPASPSKDDFREGWVSVHPSGWSPSSSTSTLGSMDAPSTGHPGRLLVLLLHPRFPTLLLPPTELWTATPSHCLHSPLNRHPPGGRTYRKRKRKMYILEVNGLQALGTTPTHTRAASRQQSRPPDAPAGRDL